MIGYLRGEILDYSDGKLLVGVGAISSVTDSGSGSDGTPTDRMPTLSRASSVVGYLVWVPQSHAYAGCVPGQMIELFIYTHIREEAFDLFGFQTRFEKDLFLTLLSVNGIGPKSALSILSGVDSVQLVEAIMGENQAFLTKIPGIGKKTAERVVLELKDVVRKKVESGLFPLSNSPGSRGRQRSGLGTGMPDSVELEFHQAQNSSLLRDAKGALLGLGFHEQDIQKVLKKAWESQNGPPQRAEDLIRSALRYLT